ncbi:Nitrilase family, member 2 [Seminavis robusta]|uniref:Nitrilase family, member 2 n=1 Tax=Seminavis robusta TaxID=568900 RepID=A0A9N8DI74_9STRA|nr:Nitrilase family, member 2 [Seminavis robusta]|eukprot:Sro156_g070920.1 Nitrilase family, member 2 (316) ;mRNA; f:80404-81351
MRSTTSNVLPDSFVPNEHTIIIGRGRVVKQHSANRKFEKMIEGIAAEYSAATCKADKGMILSRLIDEIHNAAPEAGFVKKDQASGRWYTVEESLARTTAAQALRNYLSNSYRSSKQFKQQRRLKQIQQQQKTSTASGTGSSAASASDNSSLNLKQVPVARCVSPSATDSEEEDAMHTCNPDAATSTATAAVSTGTGMADAKTFELLEAAFSQELQEDPFQPRPIALASLPLQTNLNLKLELPTVSPVPPKITSNGKSCITSTSFPILKKTILLPTVTPPSVLSLAQKIKLLRSTSSASASPAQAMELSTVPTVAV